MRKFIPALAAILLAACDDAKPTATPRSPQRIESVADIPTPENVPPPVEALAYDEAYKLGSAAGESAAKAELRPRSKTKPKAPTDDELAVLALDAAGADPKRGQKWQRGFAAGFRDGFASVVEGRR
jgi:hypothetical protein